ncbi:MAG: C69 family dipeptidase [Bacteroidales bacterium]|nr:C69 family dipeptidase [Bacteroidales bacterium]
MKKNFLLSLITTSLLINASLSMACTVIAVGKKVSNDGSVIISHTDTGPDSRIRVVHGQTYKPGEQVAVYWGILDGDRELTDNGIVLGYIPQAEKTYTYFHSAYSHVNEHQLGIAESTLDQRQELVTTRETGKQIMTIEQATIFALERYKKASEAVKFVGNLMTTYGFLPSSGDGSESLIFADTEEIWVFEVFGVGPDWTPESGKQGAIWAAQKLPDNHVTMIPNWSIIKEINPASDNFMVSDNYMQEAIDRGWYNPKSGKPFVWQDVYAPIPVEYATSRFWLFHHTFGPNKEQLPNRMYDPNNPYKAIQPYFQFVEPLSTYPFSFEPVKKLSVQDVIAFQRSTFEGTIYDMTLDPAWFVPDGKGGYAKSPLATPFPDSEMRKLLKITYRRPVARHRGHYGMVLQLRGWLPNEIGGVYWVYLDNPYFSPYIPIYTGNTSVAECYKLYNPNEYSEKSARWAIDFVDNLANLRFQEVAKDVQAVRAPFEQEMFDNQSRIETEALALLKKNPKKAQEFLTNYSNGKMDEVTAMFLQLRNEIIVKYTNNNE